MKLSKKAEYSLRALVVLARMPEDTSIQSQQLAEQTEVSLKFLEQILTMLKRAGILQAKRGVGGGYRLNREARVISVAQVIEAIEGELVQLFDPTEVPNFSGSMALYGGLKDLEREISKTFVELSIEALANNDGEEGMLGYGI